MSTDAISSESPDVDSHEMRFENRTAVYVVDRARPIIVATGIFTGLLEDGHTFRAEFGADDATELRRMNVKGMQQYLGQ